MKGLLGLVMAKGAGPALGGALALGFLAGSTVGSTVRGWSAARAQTALEKTHAEAVQKKDAEIIRLEGALAECTGQLAFQTGQILALGLERDRWETRWREAAEEGRARLAAADAELVAQREGAASLRLLFDDELRRMENACKSWVPGPALADPIGQLWDQSFGEPAAGDDPAAGPGSGSPTPRLRD